MIIHIICFLWKSTITSDKALFFCFQPKRINIFYFFTKHLLWVFIGSTFMSTYSIYFCGGTRNIIIWGYDDDLVLKISFNII